MSVQIVVFGCGALGSRIAYDIAKAERILDLYDRDRVSVDNIGTSLFVRPHIGLNKVRALSQMIGVKGVLVYTFPEDITYAKLDESQTLVIDCLDNAQSRNLSNRLALRYKVPIIHIGVGEGVGEARWGQFDYNDPEPGTTPICTHQLGIPVIALTAAIGVVAIEQFLLDGSQNNYIVNAGGMTRQVS